MTGFHSFGTAREAVWNGCGAGLDRIKGLIQITEALSGAATIGI